MDNNKLTLGVGLAQEIEHALNRNGFQSLEEVKALTVGDFLGRVRNVQLGIYEIKPIEHVIDFDKVPSIPKGWTILPDAEQLPNRVRGAMKFDHKKVTLHLDGGQKDGKWIEGNKLREKLEKVPVYGAQLGDFYMANPHLILEEWKGHAIFFWGTIYRDAGGDLCVRCLCWDGGRWVWNYSCWLDDVWFGGDPAARCPQVST